MLAITTLTNTGPDVVLQVLKDRGADPQAGLNTRATASEKTVRRKQHALLGQPLPQPYGAGAMYTATAMLRTLYPHSWLATVAAAAAAAASVFQKM